MPPVFNALDLFNSQTETKAKSNLLQVRTYDVMITYDKYYQTPRVWLVGHDEVRMCVSVEFGLGLSQKWMN